jgi:hypothetical protein
MKIFKNKSLSRFFSIASLAMVVLFTSCKKNNYSVDVDAIQTPERAQFVPNNGINRVDYYVTSAGAAYKIPVGITSVSTVDRTLNLTYSSRTAVAGQQYSAPASIVIKAGQALDTLSFAGIFAGYPSGRKDTVKIKFSGIEGVSLRDSFELIMTKYCDVIPANLAGNYANTKEYTSSGALSYPSTGGYLTQVKNMTSTGATSASLAFANLYDNGWNDITATMTWATPSTFTVTIPSQLTGDGLRVRTSTAAGAVSTFSSCDNTFTLDVDLLNPTSGAVLSSKYRFVLAR